MVLLGAADIGAGSAVIAAAPAAVMAGIAVIVTGVVVVDMKVRPGLRLVLMGQCKL